MCMSRGDRVALKVLASASSKAATRGQASCASMNPHLLAAGKHHANNRDSSPTAPFQCGWNRLQYACQADLFNESAHLHRELHMICLLLSLAPAGMCNRSAASVQFGV